MVQLFVVGEVVGLKDASSSSSIAGASCKWQLVAPNAWRHVSGATSGSSQCDSPGEEGGMFTFAHPLDVCYEAAGEDPGSLGVPRVELEVRFSDSYGRSDLGGYAVVHLPAAPGLHELAGRVWRPRGSLLDRISAFFVGGAPQLKDDRLVYGLEEDLEGEDPGTVANGTRLARSVGRQRLATAPCGEVFLRVSVCRKKGGSGGEEPIPRGREDEED